MNRESINAIVRCAFKICYIYFLKCFLPSITFGSNINLFSSTDYDRRLKEQIKDMKRHLTSVSDDKKTVGDDKKTVQTRDIPQGKMSDYTKTDEYDASVKDAAYSEIKKTITGQLREQYGDDICVEFNYEDNDKNKEKNLYSLKIKRLGTSSPKPADYSDSDIYVNTKTKTFHVLANGAFTSFPLIKHSIVKCEKS